MAVINQSQLPSNSFNWEIFWKKIAIYLGIAVGMITIIGSVFSYILGVEKQFGEIKDRLGKVEGRVDVIQNKPTPEVIVVTATPIISKAAPTP